MRGSNQFSHLDCKDDKKHRKGRDFSLEGGVEAEIGWISGWILRGCDKGEGNRKYVMIILFPNIHFCIY